MWFEPPLIVFSWICMAQLMETISNPFTCPLPASREKGHAPPPSMLSIVWGCWAGQKAWIARHLSCVIIKLIQPNSVNTSWHIYYWCNSPLAHNTYWQEYGWERPQASFRCWQVSEVNKIIEFRAVLSKRINMHEMQHHVTCAQLSITPVALSPEKRLLRLRSKGINSLL